MSKRTWMIHLHAVLLEDAGHLYAGSSFLVLTFAASIPLGLAFRKIYDGLCQAGVSASFLLGLF